MTMKSFHETKKLINKKPRCTLEKMALEVFHHHVPENHVYDPSCSGAEWWVQIRPSPAKTGRYSLIHAMDKQKEEHNKDSEDKNTSCDDDAAAAADDDDDPPTGISFHWDKDEELRLMTGGSMYIHPHISTVTYLTDLGAPTMVLDCQVASMTGSEGLPNPETHVPRAFISWPKTGKHLSFDGKHLHAAPIDLMPPGSFETQIQLSENDNDSSNNENNKKEVRRKRRVTFLVNIWLNYRPFGVNPFPHTMIDKLSKIDTKEGELFTKHSSSNEKPSSTTTVIDSSDVSQKTETFAWPLGGNDSKDNIQVKIPLLVTQQQMPKGGNVCLQFKDDFNNLDKKQWGVSFLKKEKQDTSEEDKECQSKTKQKSEQDHQNPDETKSKKQKTSSN